VRRLTTEGYNPSWSPDGSKIVYASERVLDPRGRSTFSKLSVVDASSGVARVLYAGDAIQPNWSPHGDRIAFWAIDRAGRRDLYTIAASGDPKSVVPLTADEPLDWNPVWSPDGAFVYFSSDRDGTMNLWRIAVDEKSGKQKGAPQSVRTPSPYVAFISIARSGSQIIYGSVSNTGELLRAAFDPQSEKLSPDPAPVFSGSMLLRSSAPSPDGKWIAFTTQGRQEDVFVMKSDGTDVRQLTNDTARDRGVSWWADSSRIVFYSNRSGTYAVWSIRPDGSGLTQLTANSALSANFPRVSADGRHLAYYAIEGTAQVVDISGSLPAPRTEALPPLPDRAAGFAPYAWSPDGRSIAGIPWIGSGLYVYSIPEKRYRRLKPEASMCGWIDDRRILFFDVNLRRVGVVDVASDRVRLVGALGAVSSEIFAGGPETVSISNNGRSLLVYNRHSDGDIWQMTLGGK
jgi:eukaryotic-like serine/threonine-protein kinase